MSDDYVIAYKGDTTVIVERRTADKNGYDLLPYDRGRKHSLYQCMTISEGLIHSVRCLGCGREYFDFGHSYVCSYACYDSLDPEVRDKYREECHQFLTSLNNSHTV